MANGGVSRCVGTNSTDVLASQSQLPPAGSHSLTTSSFAPGSYSAVSGYQDPGPLAPNVLMAARDFHSRGGVFKEGSFCAVAGKQTLLLHRRESRLFDEDGPFLYHRPGQS
ncbi:hypothetical protein GYMLUDRAFT_73709 [Collybiopsis luxurians FD-317 M1]|uniref:Uncharacterized protein n=1 Tax=Collybiopsis luxurians FD-317 M1 TaxID=944289 RepID=A0A0D0CEI8_9AGAR|nr:hypothetical protein GYMLUDRAFT_73709 [Collybiopsis luxurians FD-317 M1]